MRASLDWSNAVSCQSILKRISLGSLSGRKFRLIKCSALVKVFSREVVLLSIVLTNKEIYWLLFLEENISTLQDWNWTFQLCWICCGQRLKIEIKSDLSLLLPIQHFGRYYKWYGWFEAGRISVNLLGPRIERGNEKWPFTSEAIISLHVTIISWQQRPSRERMATHKHGVQCHQLCFLVAKHISLKGLNLEGFFGSQLMNNLKTL